MGDMTIRAKSELEREKVFSPQETMEYLKTRKNFRFVSDTLKELLNQRGIDGGGEQVLKGFRRLMREKGVAPKNATSAQNWLEDKVFPSKEYAIKMCFAFELSSRTSPTATEFLWNTCHVNGFNFRRADEVVFYYALERSESYSYAEKLLKRYVKVTDEEVVEDVDETKSTAELWDIFSYLDVMPEDEFFETLCENKKNFIGYRKTAHAEFAKIYDDLITLIGIDSEEESNEYDKSTQKTDNIENRVIIHSKVVFDTALHSIASIKGKWEAKRSALSDISDNFPLSEYISGLYRGTKYKNPKTKNDEYNKEHGYARKVFVLCFFAKYVIEWERYLRDINAKGEPPKKFFTDFYRNLNSLLNKCTYGLLYPRNPFDWLILNCVRSLDSSDDPDAVGLFNEALCLLINDRNESQM